MEGSSGSVPPPSIPAFDSPSPPILLRFKPPGFRALLQCLTTAKYMNQTSWNCYSVVRRSFVHIWKHLCFYYPVWRTRSLFSLACERFGNIARTSPAAIFWAKIFTVISIYKQNNRSANHKGHRQSSEPIKTKQIQVAGVKRRKMYANESRGVLVLLPIGACVFVKLRLSTLKWNPL